MLNNIRVRLASWPDREGVQALRRLFKLGPDGGLYELLNWPVFHVNVAVHEGTVVGYTSVGLLGNGVADGMGTVVSPPYRHQGVATLLRSVQARDLLTMGWTRLYVAVPEENEALPLYIAHFGNPIGTIECDSLPKCQYFGSPVEDILGLTSRLLGKSPYRLSDIERGRLVAKADSAERELNKISDYNTFMAAKAALRS